MAFTKRPKKQNVTESPDLLLESFLDERFPTFFLINEI